MSEPIEDPAGTERAEPERRRWLVRGRVQGVGFRWWASNLGRDLELAGTVRNLPDGSVEVCASGNPPGLRRFRELIERGPTGARVDSVEDLGSPPTSLPTPFEIAR